MKKRVVHALITSIVVGSFVVTPVLASPDEGSLQQEKMQAEAQVSNAGSQLADLLVQFDALKQDMDAQQARIDEADKNLTEAQEKEKQQYEKMKLRIKYLYEEGDTTFLDTALSTKSYTDFVNKVEYFQEVHKYDREKLKEYTETKEQVAALKEELESGQVEMQMMAQTYESQQATLETTVATLKSQVSDFDSQLAQAQTQANAQMQKLTAEREAAIAEFGADSSPDMDNVETEITPAADDTDTSTDADDLVAAEVPEEDAAETPDNDVAETPDNDVTETPDNNVTETPNNDVVETPNNDVVETPDNNVTETPDNDVTETPDNDVAETPVVNTSLGQRIANTAVGYYGLPYKWAGTNLSTGVDCSGFTQSVFALYGISIPRTAEAQWAGSGRTISYAEALPGDLVCYSGHVGIYVGNGQMINATKPGDTVRYTPISYRQWLGFKRYW